MAHNQSAELIAIGDELLTGLRSNGHLVFLGDNLLQHGLPIYHSTEVRDEPEDVAEALRLALGRSPVIITTGGLGPTEDDLTVPTIASVLGRNLVHDHTVESDIREFFRQRGRGPTENNFRQARLIEGAEVIRNPNGTAPGQWVRLRGGQILVLLPGPPMELQPMFRDAVLPRLIEEGIARPNEATVHLRTMGVGESGLANMLEPLLSPLRPKVRIAYCATSGYVDVRLSAASDAISPGQLRHYAETCREMIGDGFLGYGAPDVACLILKQLRSLNKSIAVAESCTGGLLASRFTDVPGASKVFNGGVVCYKNAIKENVLGIPSSLIEQHGAVSPECAVAMATAVAEMMESDYALAITGYAGPEGGSEPAGTVYLGYHSPIGVWSHRLVLPGSRTMVKERAVGHALDFVRRKLKKYHVHELLESLRC